MKLGASVAAFMAGTWGGALATGMALFFLSGLVRWIPEGPRLVGVALAAIGAAAIDRGYLSLHLPQRKGMIPPERFAGSLARGMFLFGAELGTGVRTYLPSAAAHVVALLMFAWAPSIMAVVTMAAGWALGRTIPVASRFVQRADPTLEVEMRRSAPSLAFMSSSLLAAALILMAAASILAK